MTLAGGAGWTDRLAQVSHRLDLLEVFIREQGLPPVRPPAAPGPDAGVVARDVSAHASQRTMDRQWELLEHYVAVLEQRKARAEQVGRGEDPGPWLRLIRGGRT